LMKGVEIGSGDAYPGRWLAINPGTAAGTLPGEKTVDPAFGLDMLWVESAAALLTLRFVQAVGVCAATVIWQALVTDYYPSQKIN
ncbi:hypothetical protein ONJ17_26495, partial [Salmonella enterica subsp. enterica serovar Agona]|nr:hypothetical protein [Salmonella enterica subsp. enterica serovar Agona]